MPNRYPARSAYRSATARRRMAGLTLPPREDFILKFLRSSEMRNEVSEALIEGLNDFLDRYNPEIADAVRDSWDKRDLAFSWYSSIIDAFHDGLKNAPRFLKKNRRFQ